MLDVRLPRDCLQTLFTIGYGDAVVPISRIEIVYGCIWIVATCFLNALLIAAFTSIIANQVGAGHWRSTGQGRRLP